MSACAQAPAPAPADQKVEVSAQPLTDTEQRRRDPVAKTVVGRDEIEKYGDTNLSDVLKRLPGVNMSGGNPRLRGLGSGYTLVLVNGEPAPPGFSLDNLSPSQVERIEITRGPSADQSAQAVAGTLNIILREAPRTRQRELRVGTGYTAHRPTLSGNGQWGDREGALSYTLPLSIYQWRGQRDVLTERTWTDPTLGAQQLRTRSDESFWGGGFNFSPRFTWKFSEADSLNLQVFSQRHNFNNRQVSDPQRLQGTALVSVDDLMVNHGHWQMQRANLQWQSKWRNGARIDVKLGGQASRSLYHADADVEDGLGNFLLARSTQGENRELSQTTGGKFTKPLGEAHTLALGWDVEHKRRRESRTVLENGVEQIAGFDGQPFDADLMRTALFVQDEWEIAPRWSTYLGLRAERIVITSGGVGAEVRNTSQVVTPIWHINHKLTAAGRDLVRASITRSYKAPELNQLLARPTRNGNYPANVSNVEISPDYVGNPALKPELATGLDLAFEKYLPQGGVLSVGGFHRRINGLIRSQVSLVSSVPWATAPRWVSMPVNLAQARSTGIEVELKGQATELLPTSLAVKGLSLRTSASLYRSSVDGLPGPDNRLEQQQPWAATLGFDLMLGPALGGPPLTVGSSLALTPGYRIQQTTRQSLTSARIRSLDAYALWAISRQTTVRVSVNNLLADDTRSLTELMSTGGSVDSTRLARGNRRSFQAGFLVKF